ncbi:hypothetical protein [Alterinioella nitratireducens]|uniref:hypothetical protein n=1 Tax=Alterinioella nitratireducens TaxID=2735915 RepID=UPI00155753BF|nr:hypothetical protein [Alterinioella nitratireducens]NPD21736.1 hypothetical protein [Alterinioella nitratireducens]
MKTIRNLGAALAVCLPTSALAQELPPFESTMDRSFEAYRYERCAALHMSVIAWLVQDNLGPDTFRAFSMRYQEFHEAAARVYENHGDTSFDVGWDRATATIEAIRELYLSEFRALYASTGSRDVFESEPFSGDFEVCSDYYHSLRNSQ